ncbi:uncharacterized protein A1O9_08347 [Exophiala aquamarina CBS 119918]|uniref:YCII-related domain-containing protein n=1 Tax=Exophiala aquamarina CBS 119918 TaxID=1182545 RepID=A0A072P796_9EURO|nr:uncharacterized protein A1O9_08347 [Exophiala aquamarina CBS 119918]KEF55597.1 hypothetical protein A1O9_08347 [Exophiala aquamarina CBS 119918]
MDDWLTVLLGATAAAAPKEGEDKQFNGSCLVAKASSKEEVLEELRKDIYAQEGVWNVEKVWYSIDMLWLLFNEEDKR